MPNFDSSNLLDAQTILDDQFASPEMRMAPCPVTALMLGNGPFMLEDYETLRTREDRPIQVNMLTRTKRATGNLRTHNHTGTFGDAAKIVPAFSTYSDVTAISLKLLDKNIFSFNQVLANKMLQCMQNIVEDIETANAAWLRTNRTQYSKTLKGKVSFNEANDSIEIAATEGNKQRFYQLLKSAMKQNNYKGTYDVVADSILAVEAEFLKAQGGGNATNYGYQFSNLNIAESNDLGDVNYPEGIVMVMPTNSICALPWIPITNRNGWGSYMTYEGGYGVMSDPWGLGLEFAVHGYVQRADTSALNGDSQDVRMEFELSIDISKNKAPLSGNVNESVIYQAGLVV